MAYDTTEAVAKFLSGFQMEITNRERDTVAPDYYVKYSLTLSKGGKDFSTTFVSDPRAFGKPTVTQVFSALADDALTLRKYSTDEFVDKLYAQGVKPSAALRAYDSCKETNLWMQDELYLSGWEIEEISKTLTKHGDEVNTLVEKAASERAARYAYDHPKLPKGFVTIEQLQGDLDLGDLRDEVEDFDFDDDIAGRVNPCAMSVETVRAVNEKGYDAVFAEQWKAELSECDIDPEAVSVDSEAHDMENGRDGLDGNAPEKDAPEKDDRDAQPPVDTDNR